MLCGLTGSVLKDPPGHHLFIFVYETDVILPVHLGIPVMKLLQELQDERNDIRRVNQLIHLQQTREQVGERLQIYQDKMKMLFDKKTKERNFAVGDLVMKWDKLREDPGKHGNFDLVWSGPFILEATEGEIHSL